MRAVYKRALAVAGRSATPLPRLGGLGARALSTAEAPAAVGLVDKPPMDGPVTQTNLVSAINDAMRIAMKTDETTVRARA